MGLSHKLARASATAFLLAALAVPASGQVRSNRDSSTPIDLSAIRIDNFGRIDANYFRGAQPKGGDYRDLAALGVKTVIDLTGDDGDSAEKAMAESAGMKYAHIAMTTHESPTSSQLAEFMKIVNDPASQPVYVHCVGGKHRTGVMTAIYRMTNDGWSSDQAFSEMKQYKFGADFLHAEFKRVVYAYPAERARSAALTAGVVKADGTRAAEVRQQQ